MKHIEIQNASKLESLGAGIIRYGLAIVLVWVGVLKFTTYEAEGIKPLIENSPLLSWGYSVSSVQGFSVFMGVIEIALGLLIASRPLSPKTSAIGSIGAIVVFLITSTFLFTTPGIWQAGYGFPFLSSTPGQFVAKDIILLGASVWTAGEALAAAALVDHSAPSRKKSFA